MPSGRFLTRAGLAILAWLVLTEGVVPRLIEGLYSSDVGSSLGFLEQARRKHSLDYIVTGWRQDSRGLLVAALIYGAIAVGLRPGGWARRQAGTATPTDLGAIRVLVCAILLASTLWEDLPSSAWLPREMVHPQGVLRLLHALPGFDALLTSPLALGALQWTVALLLALGLVGWRARAVLPGAALGYLVLAGILREYSRFYHTGLWPLYVLIVLCFTPCADGLALDRGWARARGRPVSSALPAATYGWARYACWMAIALPYVAAGLSKLRRSGLTWFEATNLKGILLGDNLNPMQFDWDLGLRLQHLPDFVFSGLAILAVLGEVAYGLVLVSPLWRRILPPLMAAMHLGIFLMQNVLFFDLILLQLAFIDWGPWVTRAAGIRGKRPGGRASLARRDAVRAETSALHTPELEPWRWVRLRRLALLLLACWAFRVEWYPFSAMQMYGTSDVSGVVEYYRVLGVFDSGAERPFELGDAIGALADTRYRWTLSSMFDGRERLGRQFLEACRRRYNETGADEHLRRLEVQKWRWNFLDDPLDRGYGRMVARIVEPTEPNRSSPRGDAM